MLSLCGVHGQPPGHRSTEVSTLVSVLSAPRSHETGRGAKYRLPTCRTGVGVVAWASRRTGTSPRYY